MPDVKRSIKEFFRLEKELDLAGLKWDGVEIWAFLRNYYAEKFILTNDPGSKPSGGLALRGIKSLPYGFFNWFKSYRYLAIVGDNQRKEINGKWTHPLDLLPAEIRDKTLFVELPVKGSHRPLKTLAHSHVVSRFWLILFELFLIKIFPERKISGYQPGISQLEKKIGVSLNSNYLIRRFVAGQKIMKLLLSRFKPEMVFCTTSYPIMGYIVACKEEGIPVVEMQHGFIGATHRAYNVVRDLKELPYPDYLLSWGTYEKSFLGREENFFINEENVLPTGNFYLSHIRSREDEICATHQEAISGFDLVVSVSMQDPLEDEMMTFLLELVEECPQVGFLLLPRAHDKSYYRKKYTLPSNVLILDQLNTYEGIIISDVHTTVWSTTAFEALALGRPNIIMNPNGMASEVLGHLLGPEVFTTFAMTVVDFALALKEVKSFNKSEIINRSNCFFVDDYVRRLSENIDLISSKVER